MWVRTSQRRGGVLGLGDHGVTLTRREKGELRDPKSWEEPSFVRLPEANFPEPSSEAPGHSSPRCPSGSPPVSLWRLPTSNMAARASLRGWAEPAILATAALRCLYPAWSKRLPVFRLSARRRLRCNCLRSSRIRVHPTPATSTMPPKFDPNEVKVGACFRCGQGCGMEHPFSPQPVEPVRPLRSCFSHHVGLFKKLLPARDPSGATFGVL